MSIPLPTLVLKIASVTCHCHTPRCAKREAADRKRKEALEAKAKEKEARVPSVTIG